MGRNKEKGDRRLPAGAMAGVRLVPLHRPIPLATLTVQ
jgi:hypothetical protein